MAENPIYAEIAALEAQLANKRAELNDAQHQFNATPVSASAVRFQIAQVIARLNGEIDALVSSIAQKRIAADKLDTAAAQAVSQGFTPEAAYQKALGEQERSKAIKYLAMGITAFVVLAAIYWFILRKK